jgi:hypothetical protein
MGIGQALTETGAHATKGLLNTHNYLNLLVPQEGFEPRPPHYE